MPAKHKPDFLSTAEINEFGEVVRSRSKGGTSNPALSALIVQSLLFRFKRSSKQDGKHLARLIEQIALWEDRITVCGGDVWKELNRPSRGIFGPLLEAIAFEPLREKAHAHDALIVRFQYDLLWTHHRDHPFVAGSMKKQRAWLAAHWVDLDQLLRQAPCHCVYRNPDEGPPTPDSPSTPKKLFLALLAHLHCSTPSVVNQALKPSVRKR